MEIRAPFGRSPLSLRRHGGPAAPPRVAGLVLLALGSAPTLAFANAAGLPGFSGKTGAVCSPCHSGGTTQVELTGPATLAPGQVVEYTLKVTANGGTTGMGVAASDGVMLQPGTNARPLGGEITHGGPIAPTGGVATYTFQFFAPMSPGPVTIWASGLAANVDGLVTGDSTGATRLEVTVERPAGAPPDEPEPDGGVPEPSPLPTGPDASAGAPPPPAPGVPPARPGAGTDGGTALAQGGEPTGSIGPGGCSAAEGRSGATSVLAWLIAFVVSRASVAFVQARRPRGRRG